MTTRNRMLIAAGVLGALVVLAGCTATDTMWYATPPAYSTGTVYYRPGTTTPYYDYGPTYYYYDPYPYPYSYYNFGFSFRDRDDFRGGHGHSGGGMHGGGHHR